MKAIRFINKQQTKLLTIFTLIACVFSILIFCGLNIYIDKSIAYFIVTVFTFFLTMSAIKKAGKEFEEIIIEEDNLKFYFQNKMKQPLKILKSEIIVTKTDDSIEIINKSSKESIGKAYKNKLEDIKDWDALISLLNNTN